MGAGGWLNPGVPPGEEDNASSPMSNLRPIPPPSLDAVRVTHVRASLLRGMQLVAEAREGEGAWEWLLESLPEASRGVLRQGLDSFRWIETEHVNVLALAHEARFGAATISERALATVREQLKGSHPGILTILDPAGIVQQAPTIFGFYYKGGRVDVDEIGPERALLSIFAEGLFPTWYTVSCPTWLCGAVGLAGATHTEFRHHPPVEGARHRYELVWRER